MLCVSHSLFLSVSCIFMGVLCADAFEFMFALSFAIFRNLSSIRKIVFYMRHSTLNHNYSTELAVSGGGGVDWNGMSDIVSKYGVHSTELYLYYIYHCFNLFATFSDYFKLLLQILHCCAI